MKKALIASISLYLFSIGLAFGCQCNKVSHTFFDNIRKVPFVAMIEVIRKDKAVPRPQGYIQGYDYTVVKIIKLYSGNHPSNEIRIIDSKGYECFKKLRYENIGERFIVRGYFEDINENEYTEDWAKPLPKENILVLSLCSSNQLKVEGDEVIGWINKYKWKNWERRTSFLKMISFGKIDRSKKKMKEYLPQQMKIEKFERKIRFRIKK